MKYKVLGPRILVKVKKFSKEEFLAKKKYIEGSSLIQAPSIKDQDDALEMEITSQTMGEVVEIGPTAKTEYKGFDDLKIGDIVHFQRYGAVRVGVKDHNEMEHWILCGKDVLCIETEEEVK